MCARPMQEATWQACDLIQVEPSRQLQEFVSGFVWLVEFTPVGPVLIRCLAESKREGDMRILIAAIALMASTGCASNIEPRDSNVFMPLVRSMADRLKTAEQVALSKWDSGKAVYDAEREAQVISNVADMASKEGVTVEDATRIFSDQMEANKAVQYAQLNNWRRQGQTPVVPRQSLSGIIRPELDRLQIAIMQNLHGIQSQRSMDNCPVNLARAVGYVAKQEGFDALHLSALDRAVASVCVSRAPDVTQ